ncbi:MAG: S8 family serine peptidase [Chloroflexi bacterium]|nr:S8 family serine peptidase [Chloroflexota bacterium]
MKNKTFNIILLAVIILSSCTSAITSTPSIFTTTPTATVTVLQSEIAESQDNPFIEPYQDVRSNDLTKLNENLGESLIETLWFNESTRWREQDKNTAQVILKLGMNPGLGIRALHSEGVTGKGVTVAIIDQNIVLDHPEFLGKIVKYYDAGTNTSSHEGSMHGPAVTSLLVGENIGTAPDAKIYYAAVPSWLDDAQYYADALDWIVEENKKLPEGDKIRVVSVSTMPSGVWALLHKNNDTWDAAYKRASDAGILVLDCTYEQGITVPCTYDLHDPDNVAKCIPNWTGPTDSPHKRVNIPTSRTTVEEYIEGNFSYQFTGNGGLSWSVPYLAGVLAMGWQINPKLTNDQLLEMIFASAYKTDGPADIIDPKAFIDMIKDTIKK